MIGRWLASRARAARAVSPREGRPATPAELRLYLPLLWPEGPDGPIDQEALRALGRDYARAGRVMDELLADLDILCSVVGIGASSRMIEASSVAWSDAFLDAVAAGSTTLDATTGTDLESAQATDVDEVARRLAAFRSTVWGELAPSGRLLLVTWSPASETARLPHEISRVAEEIRRNFPGAVVVEQPRRRRVIAAVADSASIDAEVRALRGRCADLVTSTTPTVTAVEARAADDIARHLFRSAR